MNQNIRITSLSLNRLAEVFGMGFHPGSKTVLLAGIPLEDFIQIEEVKPQAVEQE